MLRARNERVLHRKPIQPLAPQHGVDWTEADEAHLDTDAARAWFWDRQTPHDQSGGRSGRLHDGSRHFRHARLPKSRAGGPGGPQQGGRPTQLGKVHLREVGYDLRPRLGGSIHVGRDSRDKIRERSSRYWQRARVGSDPEPRSSRLIQGQLAEEVLASRNMVRDRAVRWPTEETVCVSASEHFIQNHRKMQRLLKKELGRLGGPDATGCCRDGAKSLGRRADASAAARIRPVKVVSGPSGWTRLIETPSGTVEEHLNRRPRLAHGIFDGLAPEREALVPQLARGPPQVRHIEVYVPEPAGCSVLRLPNGLMGFSWALQKQDLAHGKPRTPASAPIGRAVPSRPPGIRGVGLTCPRRPDQTRSHRGRRRWTPRGFPRRYRRNQALPSDHPARRLPRSGSKPNVPSGPPPGQSV